MIQNCFFLPLVHLERHFIFSFVTALAQEKSLAIKVLVHPLDVTDHDQHNDHAQAVINHFHRVGIFS